MQQYRLSTFEKNYELRKGISEISPFAYK